MLKKLSFLMAFTSLTVGISLSGTPTRSETERMYREIMREMTGREVSLARGAPDSATYITVGPFLFTPLAARDGFVFLYIEARIPGEETDTLYSGVVYPHAIEEFQNSSVTFYPSHWWQYPDTTTPLDSIILGEGEASVWIKDTEAEETIVYLTSKDGFKPSLPISCTFDTSGTEATRLLIEGQERMNVGEPFPEGLPTRYNVKVTDAQGYVVSGYGELLDTSVVVSVTEENPDSSAGLLDLRTFELGQQIRVGLVGGMANVFVWDTEEESLRLVAECDGELTPDTLLIEVVPEDEPLYILSFSSGTYGTVNIDKGIAAVAMTEDGPDMDNNSSEAELQVYDIMGTPSASIYPEGPQTLIYGISWFTISDSEADSGVIVKIIPSGEPELFPSWFLGDKMVYGFKQPGEAVMVRASLPSVAVMGDTVTGYVYAEDAAGQRDTTYYGWVMIDANGSCCVMEYGTGEPQDIIPIVNGVGVFWVTDSVIETAEVEFGDAEGEPPFGAYLGIPTQFEYGIEISFEPPGETAARWVIDADGHVTCGYYEGITVKACDDDGFVDVSFTDTARVTCSGFATPGDTNLLVSSGIATLDIVNDSTESVDVVVSGAGLTPDTVVILFHPPGEAILLFPLCPDEILVNDSLRVNFYAMNSLFMTDTTYNGFIRVSVDDPGEPSVTILEGDPDSIPIIDGMGTVLFTDSEIEVIQCEITVIEPPLESPGTGELEFEGKLVAAVPESASVGVEPDSVVFGVVDVNDSLVEYNTLIDDIWVDEIGGTFPSVSLDPPDSLEIINGTGVLRIYDLEPETVMVYAFVSDSLIRERDELVGTIVFTEVGILENSQKITFLLKNRSPNPFGGIADIIYGIPSALPVSLKVYDLAGRVVKTLACGRKGPGYYKVRWDARDKPNGVYFLRLDAGDLTRTEKLILLK